MKLAMILAAALTVALAGEASAFGRRCGHRHLFGHRNHCSVSVTTSTCTTVTQTQTQTAGCGGPGVATGSSPPRTGLLPVLRSLLATPFGDCKSCR